MSRELKGPNSASSRFLTVSRRDPEFSSYLDGSFSKTQRAIPVRSLNVDSLKEEVTFEIKPLNSLERPSVLEVAGELARLPALALSVGPMMVTLGSCIARDMDVLKGVAFTSFVGVVFFHVAMNLFNDYGDHIKGEDRLRTRSSGGAIQKGWVRAIDVKRGAWALLGLAALFGLPAVLWHFAPVAIVAGLALLAGLEFGFQRFRLKYRGWAEILAFLLTGPLLTTGYAWAITGHVHSGEVVLGCIFGSITLMYFHSKNFENIMTDSQAGVRTWATRAGFDASKGFFYFTVGLVLAFTSIYVLVFEKDAKLLPALLAQVFFLLPVSFRVRKLASPLSSGLSGLRSEALRLIWITVVALIGGYFWMRMGSGGV